MTTDEPAGVRLGPADVGSRVVVRRVLAEGGYGDLLGELRAWGDVVVVRDRHGVDHEVPRAAVALGKPVPPPPPRRR